MPINTLINAVKHWASRTFATDVELEAATTLVAYADKVLLDMTVSTTSGGGSSGMHSEPFEGFVPEIGKEYRVVFDGVEYTEVAELFRGADYFGKEGIISVGYDESIYCDPNSVPFVYLYMPDTDEAYVYSTVWADHRIAVSIKDGVKGGKRLVDAFGELDERTTATIAGKVVDEATVGTGDVPLGFAGYVGGTEYAVEFDGVEYVSKCVEFESAGMKVCTVGNQAVAADFGMPVENPVNTGEPFCIVAVVAQGVALAFAADGTAHSYKVSTVEQTVPVGEAVSGIEGRVSALEAVGAGVPMFVFDLATQRHKLVGMTVMELFARYTTVSIPPVYNVSSHGNQHYWQTPMSALGWDEGGNDWNQPGTPYSIAFYYTDSEYIEIRQDGATRSWDNTDWPE